MIQVDLSSIDLNLTIAAVVDRTMLLVGSVFIELVINRVGLLGICTVQSFPAGSLAGPISEGAPPVRWSACG